MKIDLCKNCKFWNDKQAELDYSTHYGICNCVKWNFTIRTESDIRVLDRQNRTDKHMHVNQFECISNEIPIGKVNHSRYAFVTEEGFGCIHHEKLKP